MRNKLVGSLAGTILLFGLAALTPAHPKEPQAETPAKQQVAGPKAPTKSEQGTPAKTEVAPASPVAVDELFIETYENYTWVLREIERIEKASGTIEAPVSIRDLRARAGEKIDRLKIWMQEHKVPFDWSYDLQARRLIPPPQPAAKPEAAKP